MVAMLVVPTSETARATPWGPWLYAVIVSGQVSSMSCTRARKRAAARVEEMGSRRSSTRLSTRMKSRPVLGMNCQTPAEPALAVQPLVVRGGQEAIGRRVVGPQVVDGALLRRERLRPRPEGEEAKQ